MSTIQNVDTQELTMGIEHGVRWIARILSAVSIGLLTMFLTEPGGGWPAANELLGLALFPGAVAVGLALAWKYEATGGILAIGGLVGFYLWHQTVDGTWPGGPYFVLFALPAVLFLICRYLASYNSSEAMHQTPGAKPA